MALVMADKRARKECFRGVVGSAILLLSAAVGADVGRPTGVHGLASGANVRLGALPVRAFTDWELANALNLAGQLIHLG